MVKRVAYRSKSKHLPVNDHKTMMIVKLTLHLQNISVTRYIVGFPVAGHGRQRKLRLSLWTHDIPPKFPTGWFFFLGCSL